MYGDHACAGRAVHDSGDDAANALPGLPWKAGAGERIPVGTVPRDRISVWREGRENAEASCSNSGGACEVGTTVARAIAARCVLWCVATPGDSGECRE